MMDERRIEAALRAGRPDEPTYHGDVAAALRGHRGRLHRRWPPRRGADAVANSARSEFVGPPADDGGRRARSGCRGGRAGGRVAVVARPRSNPSVTTSPTPTTAMTPHRHRSRRSLRVAARTSWAVGSEPRRHR